MDGRYSKRRVRVRKRPRFNDGRPSGTIVLWQLLDGIVTPGFKADDDIDVIDVVERHIAMVFHRLLDDDPSSLAIFINGKKVRLGVRS